MNKLLAVKVLTLLEGDLNQNNVSNAKKVLREYIDQNELKHDEKLISKIDQAAFASEMYRRICGKKP